MKQVQLSLNKGIYNGISLLERASDFDLLQEFIHGIIVTDIQKENGNYHCTCISPMYFGPLFYIDAPSMHLDMQGIRISDIEQLSRYIQDYIRQHNCLVIDHNKLSDIGFF